MAWQRPSIQRYWAIEPSEVARRLESSEAGLAFEAAAQRLDACGPNELQEQKLRSRLSVLVGQLKSPLVLLLLFGAVASLFGGEWTDSAIILAIVGASAGIGYSREYTAEQAVAKLRARIHVQVKVLRDGQQRSIPAREVVPGDVVLLSAGSLVPADAVVLNATELYVNEAVLTGESFPVEKKPGPVHPDAQLSERRNCVFFGTNVRSGTGTCLVVQTGTGTEFGAIAQRLTLRPPETEFDRGIRRFGYLLLSAMSIMVLLVFGANVLVGRPVIDTLLFAVALAVGLSPELLPAILSINLAKAAEGMAERGVLVRRLNAIENLGSMDVLCTDKTGTLTEGVVRLDRASDPFGQPSEEVLELAAQNAALQTGLSNPLDEAIVGARRPELTGVRKLAEIPYDFVRKRLSVVIGREQSIQLITKGAFQLVLEVCTHGPDGEPLGAEAIARLQEQYRAWSERGMRVLAVATRSLPEKSSYGRDDERELCFRGFLTFLDHPKEGAREAIASLTGLGVSIKLITGDNMLVARHVAAAVGMRAERVLTGKELDELHDEALWRSAEATDIFAEVDPNQKERIILSLKKMGHVVGFMGDGVNDAPAMHAADTSVSVESAVDVAKEAADFVLLERGLDVIQRGVEEGRKTFANTLKYILTTTSANLGNMVSMAVASMFLPFLPLLAGQILLNNFLSDIPAVGIAGDSVDPEMVSRPRRWNMRFIGQFMLSFGALSSLFDFLTFGALLWLFGSSAALFRTGWFVESLLTELVIALVVRTRRPFYRSRPGRVLLASTVGVSLLTFVIPYLPYVEMLGFTRPPASLLGIVIAITALYVGATEVLKRRFFRRFA